MVLIYEVDMTSKCPICNKDYPQDVIESHVDKCLFLTSSDINLKRHLEHEKGSPTQFSKKYKHREVSENESRVKNPNNTDGCKPLAEIMRPSSLDSFIGQKHILGENSVLRNLLQQCNIPSMIFWGPPGCGKTSLANIIQQLCKERDNYRYVKISATTAGVNDIKEIVQVAKNDLNTFKRKTILFMDEIHRFNKLQQDIFLPNVENGVITLVGATTENPSFSLNNALLSRCRVFVLEKLSSSDVMMILEKTAESVNASIIEEEGTSAKMPSKFQIKKEILSWLSEMCDGDARIAINSFQMALDSKKNSKEDKIFLTLEDIKEGIKKSHILYDRKGEEHYNIISAFHKSIRASDENATLYWLARMLEGGEDPLFIARRLVRAASEDVGLKDPMALTLAVSAMQGCQLIGMPECDVILAHAAVYLARTFKSQEVYRALLSAKDCVKNHAGPQPSVPLHLRNAPTKLMKDLGYGRGYNMEHKGNSGLPYMPEGLESVDFFS